MRWTILAVGVAATSLVAVAGDDIRPDLLGTWQANSGAAAVRELSISGTDDSLHVAQTTSNETSEWTCNTSGKECSLTGSRRGTVSAWYNGSALVVLESRGQNIVKERYQLSSDKSKLDVEVIPVVPTGRTEKVELTKKVVAGNALAATK